MSIKPLTSMLMTQREQLSCLKQLHKQSFQPHSTIISMLKSFKLSQKF